MKTTRKSFTVQITVDLDPVPGKFDKIEDFQDLIAESLKYAVPHYNPEVCVIRKGTSTPLSIVNLTTKEEDAIGND